MLNYNIQIERLKSEIILARRNLIASSEQTKEQKQKYLDSLILELKNAYRELRKYHSKNLNKPSKKNLARNKYCPDCGNILNTQKIVCKECF